MLKPSIGFHDRLARGVCFYISKKERIMTDLWQYRQGDVFLERLESLPAVLQPAKRDNGRIVLAYGETTGHAHIIEADVVTSFVDAEGTLYLDVAEKTIVKHQDHADILLPPGVYRIVHQREYSPQEIHRVQD